MQKRMVKYMSKKRNRSPDTKSRKERIAEITAQLEEGVKAVFESDAYKAYLKCMSKFHNYSLNNTLLIALQYPEASLCVGYQAWKKDHGRQVRKGEKGIKIIAPCKYKVESEDKDENGKPKIEERDGFRVVTTFDISQTEGPELPSVGVDELKGDVSDYRKLFNALTEICPVPIYTEDIQGGAKGYYSDTDRKIVIKSDMSQMQTIKTMIHEMAHEKLHAKEHLDKEYMVDRRTKEVEAESIAYTICQHYGLDSSDYSFSYVAGWSSGKDTKELKASLERIRSAADEVITSIDKSLDKQKLRDQNRAVRDEAR
jgi:antirestriction protein ArdC